MTTKINNEKGLFRALSVYTLPMKNTLYKAQVLELQTFLNAELNRIKEDYEGCLHTKVEINNMKLEIYYLLEELKNRRAIFDYSLRSDESAIYGDCRICKMLDSDYLSFSLYFES